MVKLLVSALLALTAANALAGNMYIYKDKGGQTLLTNVNPSGNFDKFVKKVKKSNQTQNVSYGMSSNSNSTSYANSAYLSLRQSDFIGHTAKKPPDFSTRQSDKALMEKIIKSLNIPNFRDQSN